MAVCCCLRGPRGGLASACLADRRDPSRVVHGLPDILRARMLAIACGYEDAEDLDHLRHDPGFKLGTSINRVI